MLHFYEIKLFKLFLIKYRRLNLRDLYLKHLNYLYLKKFEFGSWHFGVSAQVYYSVGAVQKKYGIHKNHRHSINKRKNVI